jgi:long-subunit acyl-CoA synthetase (AMP-forming)
MAVIRDASAGAPHIRGRDDLLCIQYTSGTTALPKGAMLTNRAYCRRRRTSRAASG